MSDYEDAQEIAEYRKFTDEYLRLYTKFQDPATIDVQQQSFAQHLMATIAVDGEDSLLILVLLTLGWIKWDSPASARNAAGIPDIMRIYPVPTQREAIRLTQASDYPQPRNAGMHLVRSLREAARLTQILLNCGNDYAAQSECLQRIADLPLNSRINLVCYMLHCCYLNQQSSK